MENQKRNIIRAGIYLTLLIFIGTSGYMLIDDYSFVNAFYMTVITVSTVGYGEVQPLSDSGKVFTAILIIGSIGVLAYFLSTLTQTLFENQLSFFLKGNQKKTGGKKMEHHVIVVGYGRNGIQAVQELQIYNQSVVVIDQNHDIVISNMGKPVRFIEGDATEDETLIKADVKSAHSLITTLPNDADNLYVVLTARALNPALKIISRSANEGSEKKLYTAGVDNVVMPERVGGAHMATLVTKPDLVEFLEHLSIQGESDTILHEFECRNLPEAIKNKPLRELELRKKTGANIIGFKHPSGEYIMNPTADTLLVPDTKVFVLGTPEQINSMRKILANE